MPQTNQTQKFQMLLFENPMDKNFVGSITSNLRQSRGGAVSKVSCL